MPRQPSIYHHYGYPCERGTYDPGVGPPPTPTPTATPTPMPTPGPITLSADGRKVGGIDTVRLTWSGATSANIDVYRDRDLIATVPNMGTYTESTGATSRTKYAYQVCEAGSSICSDSARVGFRH